MPVGLLLRRNAGFKERHDETVSIVGGSKDVGNTAAANE